MIEKLRDILNTYTETELEEMELWLNSDKKIKEIRIDEFSIDLITEDKVLEIDKENLWK